MNNPIINWPLGASWLLGAAVAWSAVACSGTSDATGAGSGGAQNMDPLAGCSKAVLEADRAGDATLAGPGVDSESGALRPGTYVVATTYLALKPDKAERALELGGAVVKSLFTMKGFVAFSTTQSQSCAALRTLTIWKSEEDMLAFVTSPAHATAMAAVSELSRGSSNTVAWEGSEQDATWERAVTRLGSETSGDH